MRLFHRKRSDVSAKYDPKTWKPVVKCSICNGEQVAGLKNMQTGEWRDQTLICTPADLEKFRKKYGIDGEITKEY